MRTPARALLCLVVSALVLTPLARADLPDLIPREVLFGNPEKISPQLSPDGKFLAYIAPDKGVLNVWVRTIGKMDDHAITRDRDRGIRRYWWAYNNKDLIFAQDKERDANWHLYGVNMMTKQVRDLTPYIGVRVHDVMMDPNFPNEILVGLNKDNPELHDVYRVNLTTNTCTKEVSNPGGIVGWFTDAKFKVRGAFAQAPDGGSVLRVRDHEASAWRALVTWRSEDALTCEPLGFTPDGQGFYTTSSIGSNTARLVEVSLSDGTEKVVKSNREVDVGSVMLHPTTHQVQAVAFTKDRTEWEVLDRAIRKDFDAIKKLHDGDFSIVSRDLADKTWLVRFETDQAPIHYYTYTRDNRKGELLFTSQPKLEKHKLARMKPVTITSRDALKLHGYLTLPVGVKGKNLPAVMLVRSWPWHRDTWGYDSNVQWLANRGYAVLQLNSRGATGYGKKFANAGNREWGGRMHDDVIDGVQWLIDKGYADKDRIAIFGDGLYGGYEALVGLTFTPEVFACGVDMIGISNLASWMKSFPPYWEPYRPLVSRLIGDPNDVAFLKSRSPFFKVDRITKPLIIAQGANDPYIRRVDTDQMVDEMKKAGVSAQYKLYPDEGHGLMNPKNRLDFYASAEKFLAKHLGGRFEP